MSAFAPASAFAPVVVPVNAGQRPRRRIHCGLCDGAGHNSKSCRDQRIAGKYRELIAFDTVMEMNRVFLGRPMGLVELDANFILKNFEVPTKKWKWHARDKIAAIRHIYTTVKSGPQNLYSRYERETNTANKQAVLQDLQEMIVRRNMEEQARVREEEAIIVQDLQDMVQETAERERERQLRNLEVSQRAVDAQRIAAQCATKWRELLEEMTRELEKITNTEIRDAFLATIRGIAEDKVRVYKESLENNLNMRREANKNGWKRLNLQIDEENCPICFDVMERHNCVMFDCNHQLCFKCLPRIQKCHMCRKPVAQKKGVDYEFGLDPPTTFEYNGTKYLKNENNVVYDVETQDVLGVWNPEKKIVEFAEVCDSDDDD
jgi:hypothetical protein